MKDLFITARFGFKSWPASECGPAAVISDAPRLAPFALAAFACDRLLGKDRFQQTRIGHVTPARKVSIISTDALDEFTSEVSARNGVFWVRSDMRGVRDAVKVAFDNGSDIVLISNAKRLFPSKSLSDAARLCVDMAFGGGAVFREKQTIAAALLEPL